MSLHTDTSKNMASLKCCDALRSYVRIILFSRDEFLPWQHPPSRKGDKSSEAGIWSPVRRSHNKRAATHADLSPCGTHLLKRALYNHNNSYLSFFLRVVGRRLELCGPVDEGGSSSHVCIYDELIFFMRMLNKCMFIVSVYLVVFLPWLQKYTGHQSNFVEVYVLRTWVVFLFFVVVVCFLT